MKVLCVNGSPHEKGCTYTALCEAAEALNGLGIDTEFFWIGSEPISGCAGCWGCKGAGRCVTDDKVNEVLDIAGEFDGFLFGSPVHYAAMGGSMTAFMDRLLYANHLSKKDVFYLKPAAAVVSARRAGATAALDQMNKYFTISEMPVVSSRYWNMVHGNTADEVRQDHEGLQIMRVLGKNMAWLLKCMEAGMKAGVPFPETEKRIFTNFIR